MPQKSDIRDQLEQVLPRDYVYIRVFKRGWTEPRREGPSKVVLATPTAVKVEGVGPSKPLFQSNACAETSD